MRRWNSDELQTIVANSRSLREVIIGLGLRPAGGNYVQVKKYIQELALDTSHFLGKGWNVSGKYLKRDKIPIDSILTLGSSYQSHKLKNRLIKEGYKQMRCEKCGWAEKAIDGRIPVELHHMNGNRSDNRLENLIILCPNCHSLEDNYRGRNIGKY